MPHLVDHPANRRCVLQLHRVVEAAEAEPLHDRGLIILEPNRALDERHLHHAALRIGSMVRHIPYARARAKSSRSLPRRRAIITGSFSVARPVKVARTTLCGFALPSDLVKMFVMP